MNNQMRILVAGLICLLILFVWPFFMPEPQPGEGEAKKAETAEGKQAKAEAEESPTPAEAEAPPAEQTPAAKPWDGELRNDLLALDVTNRSPGKGGLLTGVKLLSPQFAGHTTATDSLGLQGKRTLELRVTDDEGETLVPRDTAYEVKEHAEDRVVLTHRGSRLEVTERLVLLSGYEARLEVEVKNRGSASASHQLHVTTRIGIVDSQYDIRVGLCRTTEDFEDEDKDDVEDGPVRYSDILWGGVAGKYFAALVVPQDPMKACVVVLDEDGKAIETALSTATAELGPGETKTHVFGLYIGPKELERLKEFKAVDAPVELTEAIDWGFLGSVSEWLGKLLLQLLRWFFSLVGNWGWAIVLLTITVKVITLPLTFKQMASTKRMKEIAPEMNKIKEKYANDRLKQNQEVQALFARSGVNPLAGCLPMLVQLPIWFALYSMLGAAVELVHVPFLWLPDLTEQDPYYILPLALGALMILQSRMMPSPTMDPAQAALMRWVMPVMFTVFMLFLPSGLGVYIFANIVLSLIQTAIQVGTNKNPEQPAAAK